MGLARHGGPQPVQPGLTGRIHRSGRIGFIELMFIRRETLDARRAHVTALEEVETAEAELTRALGIVPAAIGETR